MIVCGRGSLGIWLGAKLSGADITTTSTTTCNMTDQVHRDRLLGLIGRAWADNPTLRLGQLIDALAGVCDPFYVEDWEIAMRAQGYYIDEEDADVGP